jgi:hypothetical protein
MGIRKSSRHLDAHRGRNAYVEREIGSVRREYPDRIAIFNEPLHIRVVNAIAAIGASR